MNTIHHAVSEHYMTLLDTQLGKIVRSNAKGVYCNLAAEREYLTVRKQALDIGMDLSDFDKSFVANTGVIVSVDQRAKTLLHNDDEDSISDDVKDSILVAGGGILR